MGHYLCGLGEVPLQMTDNSGAVIEDGEQNGGHQVAAWREDFLGAMMAVPMEQGTHVTGLIASHLPVEEPRLGTFRAGSPRREGQGRAFSPFRTREIAVQTAEVAGNRQGRRDRRR